MKYLASFLIFVGTMFIAAPANAESYEAVPPSVTPPTCSHPTTFSYEIPFVAHEVSYNVVTETPGEYKHTYYSKPPGTYEVSVGTKLTITSYVNKPAQEAAYIYGWVVHFDYAKNCPVQPREQVRITGRCKAWDISLTVRELEVWQTLSREAWFEVTVNDKPYDLRASGVGTTHIKDGFKRNGKAKTIRVYEDGDLVAQRKFPC